MSGLTCTPDSRAAMIEQAFRLEYITLAWMVVEAAALRHGDAFQLALAAHVGLELCEHCEHPKERPPGGGGGVDAVLT